MAKFIPLYGPYNALTQFRIIIFGWSLSSSWITISPPNNNINNNNHDNVYLMVQEFMQFIWCMQIQRQAVENPQTSQSIFLFSPGSLTFACWPRHPLTPSLSIYNNGIVNLASGVAYVGGRTGEGWAQAVGVDGRWEQTGCGRARGRGRRWANQNRDVTPEAWLPGADRLAGTSHPNAERRDGLFIIIITQPENWHLLSY